MSARLEMLRRRVGDEPSDALLNDFLNDACAYILCFTCIDDVPEALWPVQVQLAAINYRRWGAEGETTHGEGGVTHSFDTELTSVKDQLRRYRLGYIGMSRGAWRAGNGDAGNADATNVTDATAAADDDDAAAADADKGATIPAA